MRAQFSRWGSRWATAGWKEWIALASVLVICLSSWLFIELAALVRQESAQQFERAILLHWRDAADPRLPAGPRWLTEVMRDITALGSAVVVVALSLLVMGYLWLRRRWRRIAMIAVTIVSGYALSNGLKEVFDRPRPDIVPHLAEVRSASFPSGHSLMSSLVYLTLGALLAQAAERRREKIYFIAAALLLTFLIGFSRVWLGVHYPTDVLAGWSAGVAWALACWLIAQRFWPQHTDQDVANSPSNPSTT